MSQTDLIATSHCSYYHYYCPTEVPSSCLRIAKRCKCLALYAWPTKLLAMLDNDSITHLTVQSSCTESRLGLNGKRGSCFASQARGRGARVSESACQESNWTQPILLPSQTNRCFLNHDSCTHWISQTARTFLHRIGEVAVS